MIQLPMHGKSWKEIEISSPNVWLRFEGSLTLCVTKRTRPKEPVPSVTPKSKSSRHSGDGSVRTGADIS